MSLQPRRASSASKAPTLRVERSLFRAGHRIIAGMDEVGRGAIAGPVSVGVVVIDEQVRTVPVGVRDSKLLSANARVTMVPKIQRWALGYAVGHASSEEIDQIGIMAALRLAGTRALALIAHPIDLVVLDGNHDWLTDPEQVGLFAELNPATTPQVMTKIKADMTCSSVAAASVLAKVERDQMMVELHAEHPHFNWEHNKGYSAPEHQAALAEHGPCPVHRQSWRLGGVDPSMR